MKSSEGEARLLERNTVFLTLHKQPTGLNYFGRGIIPVKFGQNPISGFRGEVV